MLGNINGGLGGYDAYSAYSNHISNADKLKIQTKQDAVDAGLSNAEIKSMERSGQIECETCANRTYQDGSDENVSFKAAAHISPEAAASRVRAHEAEHVSNAYDKAEQKGGKVINASVMIKTSICPECGRTYVSGGLTHTQIKYNESDPYQANAKSSHYANLVGSSIDYKV